MHRGSLRWLGVLLVLGLSVSVVAPVQAQSLPGGDWSAAAGAAGDNTYVGFIDEPTPGATLQSGASFTVRGWIVDTSAEGWAGIDDVQVLLGGNVLGHASIAQNRPDVANALGNPYYAASGFSATIASALPGGQQTLTVLAHTPGKGSWSKQVNVNVAGGAGAAPVLNAGTATTGIVLRIISPHPEDEIIPNDNGVINGVAYDTRTRAELGVGIDRVSVYLDGARGTAGSQFLGDAVQTANTWSLQWQPTKYDSVQHHILWVYARSNVTGEEALVQEEINIARALS